MVLFHQLLQTTMEIAGEPLSLGPNPLEEYWNGSWCYRTETNQSTRMEDTRPSPDPRRSGEFRHGKNAASTTGKVTVRCQIRIPTWIQVPIWSVAWTEGLSSIETTRKLINRFVLFITFHIFCYKYYFQRKFRFMLRILRLECILV